MKYTGCLIAGLLVGVAIGIWIAPHTHPGVHRVVNDMAALAADETYRHAKREELLTMQRDCLYGAILAGEPNEGRREWLELLMSRDPGYAALVESR